MPPAAVLDAPHGWRAIDFISDLHLAADTPRTFAAWSEYLLATDADAVFILGDLFEVWIGDDARHDDFEARCAGVLARAARRLRCVAFMAGNRDFLVGQALLGEAGVALLADPTLLAAFGQRVLLTHGDALCLADTAYQQWRRQVRDPRWQQAALARPLAERRQTARQLRDGSTAHQRQAAEGLGSADIDLPETLRWLHAAAATVLVHGHTHRPATAELAPGIVRHVLSDWDLDHDPARRRAEVLRLTADGFARIAPRSGTGGDAGAAATAA
jgi:UDP-2,3-diacylglucosamine hydrolase